MAPNGDRELEIANIANDIETGTDSSIEEDVVANRDKSVVSANVKFINNLSRSKDGEGDLEIPNPATDADAGTDCNIGEGVANRNKEVSWPDTDNDEIPSCTLQKTESTISLSSLAGLDSRDINTLQRQVRIQNSLKSRWTVSGRSGTCRLLILCICISMLPVIIVAITHARERN